ncbi:uncharacterized protein LOC131241261 [Magnolia sinica]|uniref:uncharacterized protein LOC131241261 n=1 Tax=Magnolia sinica TaxID=86752 RepID=UPI00265B7039|nr:uncharacterized protein LOC131241261 [Magnolia sinica]
MNPLYIYIYIIIIIIIIIRKSCNKMRYASSCGQEVFEFHAHTVLSSFTKFHRPLKKKKKLQVLLKTKKKKKKTSFILFLEKKVHLYRRFLLSSLRKGDLYHAEANANFWRLSSKSCLPTMCEGDNSGIRGCQW